MTPDEEHALLKRCAVLEMDIIRSELRNLADGGADVDKIDAKIREYEAAEARCRRLWSARPVP